MLAPGNSFRAVPPSPPSAPHNSPGGGDQPTGRRSFSRGASPSHMEPRQGLADVPAAALPERTFHATRQKPAIAGLSCRSRRGAAAWERVFPCVRQARITVRGVLRATGNSPRTRVKRDQADSQTGSKRLPRLLAFSPPFPVGSATGSHVRDVPGHPGFGAHDSSASAENRYLIIRTVGRVPLPPVAARPAQIASTRPDLHFDLDGSGRLIA